MVGEKVSNQNEKGEEVVSSPEGVDDDGVVVQIYSWVRAVTKETSVRDYSVAARHSKFRSK